MQQDAYWNSMVPELTVADLKTSLHFYEALGFTVRFRRDSPPFVYLEIGQAQLMLEEENAKGWTVAPLERPLGRGINLQIEVVDIENVLSGVERLGIAVYRDVRETWYPISATQEEGQREFLVQDPDGYLLRFAQYMGSRVAS